MDDRCTMQDTEQLLENLFGSTKGPNLWRVNALMLVNAILMGVVVGVGASGPRYRRHPVIGFLYLGATILFLPIVSLVATAVGNQKVNRFYLFHRSITRARCSRNHIIHALIWAGVVLIIGINTSAIVAGDAREGRNIGPPTEFFIKAIWIAYLTFSTVRTTVFFYYSWKLKYLLVQLFVIILTKLFFKYAVLYKARQSFAFGQSPRLIAGYMAQIQLPPSESQHATAPDQKVINDEHAVPPPALVVMGEDNVQVEKQPHGYNFKMINSNRIVTLDRVWLFDDMDMLFRSSSAAIRPKDVCFSFALFKLLRCRFAKYTVSEAGFGKVRKFFLHTLIQGDDDGQRVFGVIADELSFIHDYYYSSLPISYVHHPILSTALSLYTIAYSLFLIIWLSLRIKLGSFSQMFCIVTCRHTGDDVKNVLRRRFIRFGSIYYDAIPLYLVSAVLVLAEIRDIVSYVCSNWTKVALICHYVNHASWQRAPAIQKLIGFALRCYRCKLLNSWTDKMNQCSILVVRQPCCLWFRLRRLLRLPNQKKTKVPSAVKQAVFKALKCLTSEQEGLVPKHIPAPSPPVSAPISDDDGDGSRSPANDDGDQIAYTILVWHIATSVFEMGQPDLPDPNGQKIAATHLSRYCTYLVACSPDLLPDDDEWCKQLYEDVKKDADRILRAAPDAEYEQVVELLSEDLSHEVLKNGARLGKKLVESNTEWEELARFWSEVILYAAPSENLEGHADAIARGGELITLLWTTLAHAGFVDRLDAAAPTTGDV